MKKLDFKNIFLKTTNSKGLVIIFIVGIGLLLMPGLFSQSKEAAKEKTEEPLTFNRSAYEKELENRLANILSTIRGVSNVSVMITLEDDGESYYARNEKADEKTAADGSLAEETLQTDGSLALKNEAGGGQSPILLKHGMPRVAGVLVTANGVASPTMQASVVSAVQAVLNVAVHRVEVLEKA